MPPHPRRPHGTTHRRHMGSAGALADDYLKVWATVLGSFTYETTAGGANHVPSFRIEKVELVRKA